MSKQIFAALTAAGLIGLAGSATASPANVGVGIYLGAPPPVYAAPPRAIVHYERPVYVAPRAVHTSPRQENHYAGYARRHR